MMLHAVRGKETSLLSMVDLGEWADGSVFFSAAEILPEMYPISSAGERSQS